MMPNEEPELEEHERLLDAYAHLSAAGTELRNAMQAALNDDADASLFAMIGQAMREVSSAQWIALDGSELREIPQETSDDAS